MTFLSVFFNVALAGAAGRIPGAGRVVSWLLGAAWSLATIFAVPLLALEGPGPLETAKRSAA